MLRLGSQPAVPLERSVDRHHSHAGPTNPSQPNRNNQPIPNTPQRHSPWQRVAGEWFRKLAGTPRRAATCWVCSELNLFRSGQPYPAIRPQYLLVYQGHPLPQPNFAGVLAGFFRVLRRKSGSRPVAESEESGTQPQRGAITSPAANPQVTCRRRFCDCIAPSNEAYDIEGRTISPIVTTRRSSITIFSRSANLFQIALTRRAPF